MEVHRGGLREKGDDGGCRTGCLEGFTKAVTVEEILAQKTSLEGLSRKAVQPGRGAADWLCLCPSSPCQWQLLALGRVNGAGSPVTSASPPGTGQIQVRPRGGLPDPPGWTGGSGTSTPVQL